MHYIPLVALVAGVAGVVAYGSHLFRKFGGLLGMVFGARVLEQVGEVDAKRRGPTSIVIQRAVT